MTKSNMKKINLKDLQDYADFNNSQDVPGMHYLDTIILQNGKMLLNGEESKDTIKDINYYCGCIINKLCDIDGFMYGDFIHDTSYDIDKIKESTEKDFTFNYELIKFTYLIKAYYNESIKYPDKNYILLYSYEYEVFTIDVIETEKDFKKMLKDFLIEKEYKEFLQENQEV